MKKYSITILAILFSLALIIGCSGFDSSVAPAVGNDIGVTPGGAQDMSYIRALINQGRVPNPENFYVEGIFSEYDLPVDGPPPDKTLTIRSSHGFASDRNMPGNGLFVQIGLSSSIDPTFERNPLNLSIVVDRSGSMGSNIGEGNKLEATKAALDKLVDQLDERDLISIVLFDTEMSLLFEPITAFNKHWIHQQIASIQIGGSTNMDAGLRKGYEFVASNMNGERSPRVMLFTDANANTGDFSPDNFRTIVSRGGGDGIGLTVFGVGLDFNQELVNYISTQRGSNYFYLEDFEKATTIFDEDFKFMVTPIAFDMNVSVQSKPGFSCDAAYGFPGHEDGSIGFNVSSLFLSRNRGALLLHFESSNSPLVPTNAPIADITLSYQETNGIQRQEEVQVTYSGSDVTDANSHYFQQDGVRMAVALTREVLTMKEACQYYFNSIEDDNGEGVETGLALLDQLVDYLSSENEAFEDNRFDNEIALVRKLSENMDQ